MNLLKFFTCNTCDNQTACYADMKMIRCPSCKEETLRLDYITIGTEEDYSKADRNEEKSFAF